jgi:hypothetical protein
MGGPLRWNLRIICVEKCYYHFFGEKRLNLARFKNDRFIERANSEILPGAEPRTLHFTCSGVHTKARGTREEFANKIAVERDQNSPGGRQCEIWTTGWFHSSFTVNEEQVQGAKWVEEARTAHKKYKSLDCTHKKLGYSPEFEGEITHLECLAREISKIYGHSLDKRHLLKIFDIDY